MRNILVKAKRLHPDAVIPQYATPGSAGFDLVAIEDMIIAPGETVKVRTGLAFEVMPGYEMQIRPRSGTSLRTKLRIANAPATIDSDYRGEVCVLVENTNKPPSGLFSLKRELLLITGWKMVDTDDDYMPGTYLIRKGDRIAQGLIAPVYQAEFEEVDELSETERGNGGFGSTGVK